MPLWKIYPVADPGDSRWLDYKLWREVIVRAPTSAEARLTAAAALEPAPQAVGNESPGGGSSGLDDEKLYHVVRIEPEDAGLAEDGDDGAAALIRASDKDAPIVN